MAHSDRLFLEEVCPALQQLILEEPIRLVQRLEDDPSAQFEYADTQDFEVCYSLSSEGAELRLRILYPFLAEVWPCGSQALLDEVFAGLPVRGVAFLPEHGELVLGADAAALVADEVLRQRCAKLLASTRIWLLIGPLVERLRWLRGATKAADAAARAAEPGDAAARAERARGAVPEVLQLQLRRLETCWVIAKDDRVLVIFSVSLEDRADVALGRAFCTEFADTTRKPMDSAPPCTFSEPRDVPSSLRGISIAEAPNVGFLTLTLSEDVVRGASDERLVALARPVMTWRNFFSFHLKHAKSYLHSRVRRGIDNWSKKLVAAKRPSKKGATTGAEALGGCGGGLGGGLVGSFGGGRASLGT